MSRQRSFYGHKATDLKITPAYLQNRTDGLAERGYTKARWIEFCERMLAEGYAVTLYEARQTVSKYLTIRNCGRRFKVRFSNHGGHRQTRDDCDFFVGRNSFGTTNTEQAIAATLASLGPVPERSAT